MYASNPSILYSCTIRVVLQDGHQDPRQGDEQAKRHGGHTHLVRPAVKVGELVARLAEDASNYDEQRADPAKTTVTTSMVGYALT